MRILEICSASEAISLAESKALWQEKKRCFLRHVLKMRPDAVLPEPGSFWTVLPESLAENWIGIRNKSHTSGPAEADACLM
jgi:hypothetical protein